MIPGADVQLGLVGLSQVRVIRLGMAQTRPLVQDQCGFAQAERPVHPSFHVTSQ